MKDLFGNDTPIVEKSRKTGTLLERWIKRSGYRKSQSKTYRCKNCHHLVKKEWQNTYYKCKLFSCSSSTATDIRVNNVCDLFIMEKPKIKKNDNSNTNTKETMV